MVDTHFPATKPTVATTTNGHPTTKPQVPYRPKYRTQPPPHHRRSCCCRCCLWTTFIIITLILLAAIAGVFFYLLFRPQKPNFSISNLHTSQFNLTSTTILSKFNLTITARNPNGKITFFYDPMSISISSNDVGIAEGSVPTFVHGRKNTTVLRTVLTSDGKKVESTELSKLSSEIKNKKSLTLKVVLETKVKAKVGSVKTKKVTIRVICDGVKFTPPNGKSAATANTSGVRCKVDPRIKILAWTV